MNLAELAERNLEEHSVYNLLIFEGREYTNEELLGYAKRLANGLRSIGLKQGDKVVVMMPNLPEVLISYQGILRAGGIIIPVLFLLSSREVAHIIADSQASAVITSAAFLYKVTEALEGTPLQEKVKLIVAERDALPGAISLWDLVDNSSDQLAPPEAQDDETCVILYTSGTTGVPKGVMLSHRNLYTNAADANKVLTTRESGVKSLGVLPLSHSFGLTLMNASLIYGSTVVLMRWFDVEEAFRLIQEYRIRSMAAVPAMFAMMLYSPVADKYDMTSLEYCSSGSAPLPVEVLQGFQEKFSCEIREGYGLSEAAPIVATHWEGRPQKPGSVGQPIPGVEVKIADDEGNAVPVGEVGELLVRGPNVTPGYYKMPEQTAQTIVDGWLHTGDMARQDEDGYLFIVERKKDLIIRGGFNVYPRDIEEVAMTHPKVRDVAVVGVKHPIMGEEIVAFVVLQPRETCTEEELVGFLQEHLAKYKTPRKVIFVDDLPRNIIGKIMRKELRTRAAESVQW